MEHHLKGIVVEYIIVFSFFIGHKRQGIVAFLIQIAIPRNTDKRG